MATYLEFFELKQAPFDTGSRGQLVLGTPALRDALAAIKEGLRAASPRICVSGGRGVGKTTLSRALPKLLGDAVRVITLSDPTLSWTHQERSISEQLQLSGRDLSLEALIEGRGAARLLVLVVDGAEQLCSESLESLDALLAHRDDAGRQLLHLVLLADLHAASTGADVPLLWWMDQLTTLQLEFAPIPESGVLTYIERHLSKAGWSGGSLFTPEAASAIHRYSGGTPLAISELSDRVLKEASQRGCNTIEAVLVEEVCGESSRADIRDDYFADAFDAAAPDSDYSGLPPELQIDAPASDVTAGVLPGDVFESPVFDRADEVSSSTNDADEGAPLQLASEVDTRPKGVAPAHPPPSPSPKFAAPDRSSRPPEQNALGSADEEARPNLASSSRSPQAFASKRVAAGKSDEAGEASRIATPAADCAHETAILPVAPIPSRHNFNRLAAAIIVASAIAGSAIYWLTGDLDSPVNATKEIAQATEAAVAPSHETDARTQLTAPLAVLKPLDTHDEVVAMQVSPALALPNNEPRPVELNEPSNPSAQQLEARVSGTRTTIEKRDEVEEAPAPAHEEPSLTAAQRRAAVVAALNASDDVPVEIEFDSAEPPRQAASVSDINSTSSPDTDNANAEPTGETVVKADATMLEAAEAGKHRATPEAESSPEQSDSPLTIQDQLEQAMAANPELPIEPATPANPSAAEEKPTVEGVVGTAASEELVGPVSADSAAMPGPVPANNP